MKKTFAFFISTVLAASSCFAGIKFDNLNLNSENKMLYTVTIDGPGIKPYSVLHSYVLQNNTSLTDKNLPDLITCYPEYITSLSNGKKMQVRNRYGTALYDFENQSLKWVSRSSLLPEKSFSESPVITSPDGNWIVFIRKSGSSTGALIIQNVESKKYFILDNEALYSYTSIPVKWSADSKSFLYQKKDSVYFCNPEKMFKGIQLEEKYRRIGAGKISSVEWCTNSSFAYIDSDIIYLIDEREISSLGIYSNFYSLGKVIGRLQEKFDCDSMEFKINSIVSQMVIIKNNNFVSYFNIDSSKNTEYVKLINTKSYDKVFDGSYKFEILWPEYTKPVIWTDFISDKGKSSSSVYVFNDTNEIVQVMNVETPSSNAAISPDGKFIAFSCDDSVYIYSVNPWTKVSEVKGEKVISLCWKDGKNLCIGGNETVSLYNVQSNEKSLLFISQCKKAMWDKNSRKIIALSDGYPNYFIYNEEKNVWSKADDAEPENCYVQNDSFRVYKAESKNARFENGIYVRNLSGKVNTFALYKETIQKTSAKKKIAIVFDLLNSADGVSSIIAVCEKYQIKPTYFVNGEFIRRYPVELKKLAASGAEVGSMFYVCSDLTIEDYDVSEEYIARGLARTEDEYYKCTGKELSLLWHAPYYKSNQKIRDAGSKAGYSYVDFPIDDGIAESKAGKTIESKIIPIMVGAQSDSDLNEFYTKLELLINSLIDADYEIVPVSGL